MVSVAQLPWPQSGRIGCHLLRTCEQISAGQRGNGRVHVSEVLPAARDLAMVVERVRAPSLTPSRSSPTGRRRLVQVQDSEGSNPSGGTHGE